VAAAAGTVPAEGVTDVCAAAPKEMLAPSKAPPHLNNLFEAVLMLQGPRIYHLY
jgi:hypothetical protein